MFFARSKCNFIAQMSLLAGFLGIALLFASSASAQALGGACSTNGVLAAPAANGNMFLCNGSIWTATMFYSTGTSVGIGTTNPGRTLHVNGPMRLTAGTLPGTPGLGDIAIDSGSGNSLRWYNGTGWQTAGGGGGGATNAFVQNGNTFGAAAILGTNDNNALLFETFNTARMAVNSIGRVGIGTTLPTSRVHAVETLNAASGNEVAYRFDYTTNKAAGNDTGLLISMTDTASPGTSLPLDVQVGGTTLFSVWANGTNPRVGIGTSAPTTILDIYGNNGNSLVKLQNDNASGISGIDLRSSGGTARGHIGWSNADSLIRIQGATAHPMVFDTNTSERMRITATGNVGIGTTLPNRLLEVAGPMRLTAGALPGTPLLGDIAIDSGFGNSLRWYNGTGWQTAGGGGGATNAFLQNGNTFGTAATLGTNDNFALNFETNNSNRMTILTTGNVGIGTTNPSSVLHAYTAGAVGALALIESQSGGARVRVTGDNTSGFDIFQGGSAIWSLERTGNDLRIRDAANGPSPLLIQAATGNVGIGTTVPSRLLHVNGPMRLAAGTLPGTPIAGDIAIDSGSGNALRWYNGTGWQTAGGGGGGGLPASSLPIYQVRAASTANVATLSGAQTIDGVSVVAGDRVLLKNQSTDSQNGVYVVSAGAWTRATDMDDWNETIGYQVRVSEGTAWTGMTFTSATSAGGTLGTTAIQWNAAGSGNPGKMNTAIGYQALYATSTGGDNTAHGYAALTYNTNGYSNTALGSYASQLNTTGSNNTAIGHQALHANRAKADSTAVGYRSMRYADDLGTFAVTYNTALGAYSLYGSTTAASNTGIRNTALGHSALMNMTSGSGNVGIGFTAGSAITTGSNNIVIGSNTGSSIATSSNNILIADGAGNERIRINSSGNVGIGTTSMAGNLHVKTSSGDSVINIDATTDAVLRFDRAGTNRAAIWLDDTGDILNFDTSASTRLQILSTGQVGINQGNPNSALDLNGAFNFRGTTSSVGTSPFGQGRIYFDSTARKFRVSENGGAYADLVGAGGSSNTFIQNGNTFGAAATLGTNDSFALNLETAGSTRMTITSTGSIGIGTASPERIFHVKSGVSSMFEREMSLTDQLLTAATVQATSTGSATEGFGSALLYQIKDSSNPATMIAAIGAHRDGAAFGNGILSFRTATSGSPAEQMRINAAGNVGIGTSDPQSRLEVFGSFGLRGVASVGTSPFGGGRIYFDSGTRKFRVSENGGAYTDLVGAGASNAFVQNGNAFAAAATLGTNDNFALNFETFGTTRMTILADGNMGLGTVTPAYPLSIYRATSGVTSNIESGSNGAVAQSRFAGRTAGGVAQVWGAGLNITNGAGGFEIYDYTAGSSRMMINTSGNVGIGTVSPTDTLVLNRNMANWSRILNVNTNSAYGSGLAFGTNTDSFAHGWISMSGSTNTDYGYGNILNINNRQGHISLWSGTGGSSSERMIIRSDGNIGIGITSPNRLLHVNGPMRLTAGTLPGTPTTGDIAIDSTSGNALRWYNGTGWQTAGGSGGAANAFVQNGNSFGTTATLGTNDGQSLAFETFGTTQMTINSVGEIGIGAAPSSGQNLYLYRATGTNRFRQFSPDGSIYNSFDARNGYTIFDFTRTGPGWTATPNYSPIAHWEFNGHNGSGGAQAAVIAAYTETVGGGTLLADLRFSTSGAAGVAERLRINSSGNVGIGVAAPGRLLHVAGPMRLTAGTLPGTPGLGDIAIDSTSGNALRWYNGTGWQTAGGSGGTSQWITSGTNIYYSTGNVGIGTASPGAQMEISGATGPGGVLRLSSRNTNVLTNEKIGVLEFYNFDTSPGVGAKIEAVAEDNGVSYGLALSGRDSSLNSFPVTVRSSGALVLNNYGAASVSVDRKATNGVAGTDLNLQAGAATLGNTDLAGGNLVLSSGVSTGNAGSNIHFYATQGSQGPGTTDRTPSFMGGIDGSTRSIRLGIGSSAGGMYGMALGYSASASGTAATAIGQAITVSGTNSVGFNLDSTSRTVSMSNTMAILGGNVAIGTTSPTARLDVTDTSTTTSAIVVPRAGGFTGTAVNGMIRYNTTSNLFEYRQNGAWVNYTTTSDGRLKTDVEPVTNGLDIVNQLNPVFYNWDQSNPRTHSFGSKHEVGFIAQEVEKVLPEVVNKGEDSYRSIEYGKIVSVVAAAVKELYRKLLVLEERVAGKDRQIASLREQKADKSDVEALKIENEKLKKENEERAKQLNVMKAYLCSKDPKAVFCR